MDQLLEQISQFVQTPVGIGVAAVVVIIALLIVRKVLSILFLVAGLAAISWAVLRYSDVIDPPQLSAPSFDVTDFVRPSAADAPAAEAASAPLSRSFGAPSDQPGAQPASTELAGEVRELPLNYNRPAVMALDRPTAISLVIDATGEDRGGELLDGFEGEIVSGSAQLTPHASAALSGSGFDIELLTPARQVLSDQAPNRWNWQVTPTQQGQQVLTLQVYAHPGESGAAQPVAAYTDRITVRVTRLGMLVSIANRADPVIGAAAGGLSILLALFTMLRRRKRRA